MCCQAIAVKRTPEAGSIRVANASRGARNGTLDLLRFAAAIAIVLFHAKAPGGWLVTPALTLFTVILTYQAGVAAERPFGLMLRQRSDRLLRPFAIWVTIYGLLRLADGGFDLAALRSWLPPEGTMHQLWFLPFGFVISISVAAGARRLRALGPVAGAVLPIAAGALLAAFYTTLTLPPGLSVFLDYLPPACFGLALAALGPAQMPFVSAAGVALVLALGGAGIETEMLVGQFLIGLPLTVLALLVPLPPSRLTLWCADRSIAVYLVHPLVLSVVLRLTGLQAGAMLGLLVIVLSVALSEAIYRLPRLSRLLF